MNTDHVVAHDGTKHPFGFECLHCGAVLAVALPVSNDEFVAAGNAFVARHRECKPDLLASAKRVCREFEDSNGSVSGDAMFALDAAVKRAEQAKAAGGVE